MSDLIRQVNKVRYSGFDFDSINDELLARLQVEFLEDFNDFALSSLGIVLLDSEAFGIDSLSFYLDRRATETFLQTARTRAAVTRLARQLGYKVGGAVAASTSVSVSITNPQAFSIPIAAGTQFQGPNGLIFEVTETTTFPPLADESSPLSIPLYEGETIVETFVSTGLASQIFEITTVPEDKSIVQGSVTVTVDGVDWEESDILTIEATDQFEISPNEDPPLLRFGDGEAGNIPVQGATIELTYIACSGSAGNVSKNTIEDTVEPLVVSGTTIELNITNPTKATGGDDLESLARVRALAPSVMKTRGVTVTQNDYEAIAGSFADPVSGRVAIAKAISSKTGSLDLTLQNYILDIISAVNAAQPAIDTEVAAIQAQSTLIDNAIQSTPTTNTDARLDDVVTSMTSLESQKDVAQTTLRLAQRDGLSISESTSEITSRTSSADSDATTILTQLGFLTRDASNSSANIIDAVYYDAMQQAANDIRSELIALQTQNGAVITASGTVQSSITSVLNSLGLMEDLIAEIGTDRVTTGTYLKDLSDNNDAVISSMVVIDSSVATISDTPVVTESAVVTATQGITDHITSYLAADCTANLITVPILTKDEAGFFAAPSNALIQSLQDRLDSTKEVSQSVVVTSGERFLIPAVITVRAGVFKDYTKESVSKVIVAAVEEVLRDREFSASLYESELDAVLENVEGLKFWNVSIDGHYVSSTGITSSSLLDADGNLIISEGYVVTKANYRDTTVTPFVDGIIVNAETVQS